ncbi:MAG: transcriptional regulator, partial [Bacteroidota bacterium]|nr:transcriptional regulator [Bacteroidota bacterium]
DGAIDGAIDGATKEVKRKLTVLLKAIAKDEGKRTPDYLETTKLGSDRTMERYIQLLRDAKLIVFKGDAPQTGGYYLTAELKDKLEK